MSNLIGRFVGQLSAPLPEGWFAKESITLVSPDGQANIIASSEPLDPSIDTARYAEIQGALLAKDFSHYRELAFIEVSVLAGHRGLLRRFEWTAPDGRQVRQVQFYLARGGRGYTATATCLSPEFDRFELTFRHVLGGMMLIDAASVRVMTTPDGAPEVTMPEARVTGRDRS